MGKIESSFPPSTKFKWFVVESNSTSSSSVLALESIAKARSNFRFVSLGQDGLSSRIERIARARNAYLDFLRLEYTSESASGVLCVVADLDGLNTKLRIPIEPLWEVLTNQEALFPIQLGPYYDISALRHDVWCPKNPWQDFEILKHQLGTKLAHELAIKSKQIRLPAQGQKISVRSAFGGIGIYPLSRIVSSNARYFALDDEGFEECEHVSFNFQLGHEGLRLFIDPRISNAKYTEHTRASSPFLGVILRFRTSLARSLPPLIRDVILRVFFR
jgi:hypothetical protein